jgi:hypothetical protein
VVTVPGAGRTELSLLAREGDLTMATVTADAATAAPATVVFSELPTPAGTP